MQPRRTDSKKWTVLPKDYLDNVQTTVKSQYENELSNVEVISEGRVFEKEMVLRIGFLPIGRLKQYNFEVSFDIPEAKDHTLTKLNNALDFLGTLLNEFLAKNGFEDSDYEAELPVLWKPMTIDKQVFHFQYSTANTKLESLADEWLNKMDSALVNETSSQAPGFSDDDAYNFAEQYDAETLEQIIELKKHENSNVVSSDETEKQSPDSDWLH